MRPFNTIITMENMVSRASVGFGAPVVMTMAIVRISMLATDSVRIIVPYGSPSMTAR